MSGRTEQLFNVKITKTLEKTITVAADSEHEARDIALEMVAGDDFDPDYVVAEVDASAWSIGTKTPEARP